MTLDPTEQEVSTIPCLSWSVAEWNRRLLAHFFERRLGEEDAVVVLLVTAEELCAAAGAPMGDASRVRDAFVSAVRRQIHRSRDLLEDATEYQDWPREPLPDYTPRFIAHLIFTCLAAAESDDDLADENTFIGRLRTLTDNQLADSSLGWLPTLWENLAKWLIAGDNRCRFRALVLPEPGGLRRIGYTVKLTFPDRRDQARLARLIHERHVTRDEPPMLLVLRLVSRERGKFSKRFVAAFDDFQRRLAPPSSLPRLRTHPFWAAVRAASLRGRQPAPEELSGARFQLIAEPGDEHLSLFLATNAPLEGRDSLFTISLPFALGEWTHAVQRVPSTSLDGEQLAASVQAVFDELANASNLPGVSSIVAQGLVAFFDEVNFSRIAGPDELEDVTTALVRDDLLPDLLRVFGSCARQTSSAFRGWTEVRDLKLRRLSYAVVENTGLSTCWQLHEVPRPPKFRLVNGIRLDDGWLGYSETLPSVSAPEAQDVWLVDRRGKRERLSQSGGGTWEFPARDLDGALELTADTGGDEPIRKEVNFRLQPALERDVLNAGGGGGGWMVEGFLDSAERGEDPWRAPSDTGIDAAFLCERIDLLGPVVGEFVNDTELAAWRIVQFAGQTLGSVENGTLCEVPIARIANDGARRRWRKLLSKARFPEGTLDSARRASRSNPELLPVVAVPSVAAHSTEFTPPPTHPRVGRLVAILASISHNRAHIGWGEWRDLVVRVLSPPPETIRHVMRAWEEVGYIDLASSARWRNLVVFVRKPRLVAVRAGAAWRATLIGLVVPVTLGVFDEEAKKLGILVEKRRSVCPLVPGTLTLRSDSAEKLRVLAENLGLDLDWLDTGFACFPKVPRGRIQQAPSAYERETPWTQAVAAGVSVSPPVSLTRSYRTGCPDYWTAKRDDKVFWTYHPNLAFCTAAHLSRERALESIDAGLIARRAYLPLPLARIATLLGAVLPGPDPEDSWSYRYSFTSDSLREMLLGIHDDAFSMVVQGGA